MAEHQLVHQLAYDPRWSEVGPLGPRAHLAIAAVFERLNDGGLALEHYGKVVELAPADVSIVRALVRMGLVLQRAGDAKGARQAYESARAHPACIDPWPGVIDRALAEISVGSGARRLGR
jgi:hypothetical protein